MYTMKGEELIDFIQFCKGRHYGTALLATGKQVKIYAKYHGKQIVVASFTRKDKGHYTWNGTQHLEKAIELLTLFQERQACCC